MLVASIPVLAEESESAPDFTSELSMVSGAEVRNLAEQIVDISDDYPAMRCAGSRGANFTADHLVSTLSSYGLEAWKEDYDFLTWDLGSIPMMSLVINDTPSEVVLGSFTAEHMSWPSNITEPLPLMILPLPSVSSRVEIYSTYLDDELWQDLDTTGKVVMIGREVRWVSAWEGKFIEKITEQRPAAVVFFYWYNWMAYAEENLIPSGGGVPLSDLGPYMWDLQVPSGSLNLSDASVAMTAYAEGDPMVNLSIPARIANGQQSNVVAKLDTPYNQTVMVTAHYDSVTVPGLLDNAGGVAGMLEIARIYAEAVLNGSRECQYDLLFVAFNGEELGMVGSTLYVQEHLDDLEDVIAVVNLDCIGAEEMRISTTNGDDDWPAGDLDAEFLQAAGSLGVELITDNSASSDHASFLYPRDLGDRLKERWGINLSLPKSPVVANALSVYSTPLTLYEINGDGEFGLIHTRLDSTSTSGHEYWMNETSLEDQVKVTLSVLLRITTPVHEPTDWSWVFSLSIGIILVAACVVVLVVMRKAKRTG